MDWQHLAEVVGGNLFVAGVAYGAIKADLRGLHERLKRVEEHIDRLIFKKGT